MVCQAASQTKFRAHKHESGIAGRPTIIVRVIACFQPLQSCQVACSFGRMVTAKDSPMLQLLADRKPPDLDCMERIHIEQNHSLQCSLPIPFNITSLASPGQCASSVRGFISGDQNPLPGSVKLLPTCGSLSINAENSYLKDSQCVLPQRFGITNKLVDAYYAQQKRFLIFDQSGNQTRLFFGPSLPPPVDQNCVSKKPACSNGLGGNRAALVYQQYLVKPEEKWDQSYLADGQDEMLESSEEIDALLDSDTDADDVDDDDDDDDEVTSSEHGPLHIGKDYDKSSSIERLKEEVASSDDSPKRQRLLDGRLMKSSVMSVNEKLASSRYEEDDVESSRAGENIYNDISSSKRETKVKIRKALKIMERIIPGLRNNDNPLSIIDRAIVYLKTMKAEAEALGPGDHGSESATFS